MSDVIHWTDLPKEIGDDFVSYPGDYDYPFYLSEKEEWVHCKRLKNVKGKIKICEPFLIMELNRFVPYLENKYVKFHPLNMPHLKIGKIEIMGFVIYVSQDPRFYEYHVDDGTGAISIYQGKKQFRLACQERKRIDDKYSKDASNIDIKQLKIQECPKHLPKPRPNFKYPSDTSLQDIAIFEHNWAMETNNGTLGREVQRCDYIHATGYCTLDFLYGKRPREEITFSNLSSVKITFLATKVTCLSEHEYNRRLYSWLNTVVRRRYDENPNEPEFIPKPEDLQVQVESSSS